MIVSVPPLPAVDDQDIPWPYARLPGDDEHADLAAPRGPPAAADEALAILTAQLGPLRAITAA
jgi:hypothetical protein